MLKKNLGSVLFFGRDDCFHSNRIKILLKQKAKKFYYFKSRKIGEKINKRYLKLNYDYIFCFRSYYILKKNLLTRIKKAAINFHPGPPEYRGTGCVNYAIYNNSKFYGCTAHLINEKVDNGKILDVKKFNISNKETVEQVLSKTYKIMATQAKSLINKINLEPEVLKKKIKRNKKLNWSKKIKTLKQLDQFYEISKNIRKDDFLKKIRATNTSKFKPYIFLHGKKFIIE